MGGELKVWQRKETKSNKTEKKNNDITGIILISMGIFVLFSVFSPSASGIVGSFIKKVLIAVLGLGSLVFPILIIFTGCCFIGKKNKINLNSKFYGIVLFSINTLFIFTNDTFKKLWHRRYNAWHIKIL